MKVVAREIAIRLNLEMKISDIEFQGDASKATFYYTANDRVDFRQLIKDFAREFSIRIEMKQVGFRQEASRLGGIGSCGRELCCSTWLTDFRSVNTSAARYQQLSLNPQKLAGQCGKLKCCLNYELDTYLDALKGFPDMDTKLYTEKGDAVCQKVDIFKGLMWFAYFDNMAHWHVLEVDQVKEIVALNKQKERISALEDYAVEAEESVEKTFQNAVGQDSLTRFDAPKKRNKKRGGKKGGNKEAVTAEGAPTGSGDRKNNNRNNRPKQQNGPKAEAKPQGEGQVREPKPDRQDRPQRSNQPRGERKPDNKPQRNPEAKGEPRPERQPRNEAQQGERPEGAANPNKKRNNRNKNRNRNKPNDNNAPTQE
jgi:cell fate regulator YaaT (PSP1 superfamily)